MSPLALETILWEAVQHAYEASRCYRAGDDPAVAKALAEYERVAFPNVARNNVISFRRGVRK
jgi:hypothetical protein